MDANASYEIKGLDCPTGAIAAFEIIGDFPQLSNQESDPANDNPGASGNATGANVDREVIKPTLYQIAAGLATFAGVLT